MGVLSELEPKKVFEFFELCSSVPHGSGNTKQVSDICVKFAKDRGLDYYQDGYNNVIIRKPATKGYENSPTVILQGHLDMVCAKYPDDAIDMSKEAIKLQTDGKYVWAHRTSLGGDDMIAVATALAILDSDTLAHPTLEAVFTVDEETGLFGAWGIDPSQIKGRLMLNMDSEDEGVFTAGCAGGLTADFTLPLSEAAPAGDAVFFKMTVGGLIGGHSGMEIIRQRGNSNLLSARILHEVSLKTNVYLSSMKGGSFSNVIPSKTYTVFAVSPLVAAETEQIIRKVSADIKNELALSDPGFECVLEKCPAQGKTAVAEDSKKVLDLLFSFPDGVQNMCIKPEGLVETSLNTGILNMTPAGLKFTSSVRSSVESRKKTLAAKLVTIAGCYGAGVKFHSEYPSWPYRADSPLRELAMKVYREQTGKEASVEVIHAGLECGIFASKLEGLDCISFGPNMKDIHSVNEKLDVPSVGRMYELVCGILEKLK